MVFTSLSANNYVIVAVNSTFLEPGPARYDPPYDPDGIAGLYGDDELYHIVLPEMRQLALDGELDRLEVPECIEKYQRDYLPDRSNLLLVTPDTRERYGPRGKGLVRRPLLEQGESIDDGGCAPDGYAWMCPGGMDFCTTPCRYRINEIKASPETWRPLGVRVNYCLSRKTEEQCKLLFSLPLAIVVIGFNLIKIMLMFDFLVRYQDSPLLTIGDAVSTILDVAPTLEPRCPSSSPFRPEGGPCLQTLQTKSYQASRHRWRAVVSGYRWAVFGILYKEILALKAWSVTNSLVVSRLQLPHAQAS